MAKTAPSGMHECWHGCSCWEQALFHSPPHGTPHITHIITQAFELQHFMVRHEVQKSDNFARLSLLYDCSPAIIRAANNVISDASLQSRLFIYMPGVCCPLVHAFAISTCAVSWPSPQSHIPIPCFSSHNHSLVPGATASTCCMCTVR